MTRAFNPSERRAFGRRESFIHAVVRVPGRPPEPCIVRNYSEGGALIEFPVQIDPPQTFRLIIESKRVDTLCDVRRRSGKTIGVQFLDPSAGQTIIDAVQTALSTSAPQPSIAMLPPEPIRAEPRSVARPVQPILRVPGHEMRRQVFGAQA
jgi:hypothetical protein